MLHIELFVKLKNMPQDFDISISSDSDSSSSSDFSSSSDNGGNHTSILPEHSSSDKNDMANNEESRQPTPDDPTEMIYPDEYYTPAFAENDYEGERVTPQEFNLPPMRDMTLNQIMQTIHQIPDDVVEFRTDMDDNTLDGWDDDSMETVLSTDTDTDDEDNKPKKPKQGVLYQPQINIQNEAPTVNVQTAAPTINIQNEAPIINIPQQPQQINVQVQAPPVNIYMPVALTRELSYTTVINNTEQIPLQTTPNYRIRYIAMYSTDPRGPPPAPGAQAVHEEQSSQSLPFPPHYSTTSMDNPNPPPDPAPAPVANVTPLPNIWQDQQRAEQMQNEEIENATIEKNLNSASDIPKEPASIDPISIDVFDGMGDSTKEALFQAAENESVLPSNPTPSLQSEEPSVNSMGEFTDPSVEKSRVRGVRWRKITEIARDIRKLHGKTQRGMKHIGNTTSSGKCITKRGHDYIKNYVQHSLEEIRSVPALSQEEIGEDGWPINRDYRRKIQEVAPHLTIYQKHWPEMYVKFNKEYDRVMHSKYHVCYIPVLVLVLVHGTQLEHI